MVPPKVGTIRASFIILLQSLMVPPKVGTIRASFRILLAPGGYAESPQKSSCLKHVETCQNYSTAQFTLHVQSFA